MKLNKNFITHNNGDEQIVVSIDQNFNGFIRNNRTAAEIVELLKSETDKDSIVNVLFSRYDAPKEIIEKDVERILKQLKSIGAIDD